MKIRALITIDLGSSVYRRYSTEDLEYPTSSPVQYEGRLIDSGNIAASLTEMYFGTKNISTITFSLDNTDKAIRELQDSYELRGCTVTIQRVDIDAQSELDTHTMKITAIDNDLKKSTFTAAEEDLDIWDTIIPKNRVTTDAFTATVPEAYRGKPIHTWFGICENIELYCIQEDSVNDYWDYLVGHGTIDSVTKVYREGDGTKVEVPTSVISSGANTSSSENTLIDSGATFVSDGIAANIGVKNTNAGTYSFVVSVDSEIQLTLRDHIFPGTPFNYEVGGECIAYDGSQVSPFNGYAFVRFPVEQRDYPNLNLYKMTADIEGINLSGTSAHKNPVFCLREFIINSTWGLGLTVNGSSFTAAGILVSSADYYVGGGFWEFKKASEWRDFFLQSSKLAQLSKGPSGYEIYIPEYKASSEQTFDEYNMQSMKDSLRPSTDYVKTVRMHSGYRIYEGNYTVESSYSTGKSFGVVKEYYNPFSSDATGAENIGKLIRNRFQYQDRHIVFITLQDGADLSLHDIITINHGGLNISSQAYEIINIAKSARDIKITAAEYSDNIFTV